MFSTKVEYKNNPNAIIDNRIKVRFKKVFIQRILLGYKDNLKAITSKIETLIYLILLWKVKYWWCDVCDRLFGADVNLYSC